MKTLLQKQARILGANAYKNYSFTDETLDVICNALYQSFWTVFTTSSSYCLRFVNSILHAEVGEGFCHVIRLCHVLQ